MLNEKKVMKDKFWAYTWFTIISGFLGGLGLMMFVAGVGLEGFIYPRIFGAAFFVALAIACAIIGDKIGRQIKDYIMSPYVKMEEENDKKNTTVLDPPTD